MAKVVVAGDAVVIESAMSLEELKLIKKYRKDALILKGGEDGKEPIFAIGVSDSGDGCVKSNSITFAKARQNADGNAIVTVVAPDMGADVAEWVADNFGAVLNPLSKLEETLPGVIGEILADKAAILSSITVME